MSAPPPPPPFLPGARTLGILGGGQLGMMLTSAAVRTITASAFDALAFRGAFSAGALFFVCVWLLRFRGTSARLMIHVQSVPTARLRAG